MDTTYRCGRFLTANLSAGKMRREDLGFWSKLYMKAPEATEQAFAKIPASQPDADTVHDLYLGAVPVQAAAEAADESDQVYRAYLGIA